MAWEDLKSECLQIKLWLLEVINNAIASLMERSISEFTKIEYLLVGLIAIALVMLLARAVRSIHTKSISFWKIAAIPIAVVLIYGAFFCMLVWNVSLAALPELIRKGEFGDSFGTLNALFSGLAFAGVVITLLMQKADLAVTRNQTNKQQIESQFYSILNLQQQVIQGFDLHLGSGTSRAKTVQGRDCFREWRRKLKSRYEDLEHDYPKPIEVSIAAYDSVLRSHLGDLGLYFRSLYNVFRFIEGVELSEQKKYSVIVRSLLSDYELLFLFYNCLSMKGERFMRFAKAYSLFDNLNVQLLMDLEDVTAMGPDVYGENSEALAILTHFNSQPLG